MALRKIVVEGDEILRKVSKKVEKFDNKLTILLDDMKETMYHENGVGLACVQIGVLKRIFVMDIRDERGFIEFINAEIIEQSGEQISCEGCLSIPGYEGDVVRPEYVKVKAQDRNGKEFIFEANDLGAICISHEYDHLDGILFKDKVLE